MINLHGILFFPNGTPSFPTPYIHCWFSFFSFSRCFPSFFQCYNPHFQPLPHPPLSCPCVLSYFFRLSPLYSTYFWREHLNPLLTPQLTRIDSPFLFLFFRHLLASRLTSTCQPLPPHETLLPPLYIFLLF